MTPSQLRIMRQASQSAIASLWDSLVPLRSVGSFMQTGAHPDDETSRLLARLSRGDGVRVSYVCAVRGEGGQNDIGTELRATLGVLRTREMEQAAKVLDMQLYWLNEEFDGPIFDFGLSKSATETFEHWGRERTVAGLVRAIRTERPDVMAPTFLDIPGQHGHHRAITVATEEAIALAADPNAFPQQLAAGLRPWQVKKFYLPAWSGAGGAYDDEVPPPNATLSVDVGKFDPVHGATYAQIAQWSRVFHRTQGMGHWAEAKPDSVPLHRKYCALDNIPETETGIFDGLPRTLTDLAGLTADAALAGHLVAAQAAIDAAFAAFPANTGVAEALHRALGRIRAASEKLQADDTEIARDIAHRLTIKQEQLCRASFNACLLICHAEADRYELSPGETTTVNLSVFAGADIAISGLSLCLDVTDGWHAESAGVTAASLAAGNRLTAALRVSAPGDAAFFFPYRFHTRPDRADDPVAGSLTYTAGGQRITVPVALEQTLAVLPPVSLEIEPTGVIHNIQGPASPLVIDVKALSNIASEIDTTVRLRVPHGWAVAPAAVPVSLAAPGAVASASFTLTPPAATPGTHRTTIDVVATRENAAAARSDRTVRPVAYPHIRNSYRVMPARVTVQSLSALVPDVKVGYVDSGSDRAHYWLRQLGVRVDLLPGDFLATGDLQHYDTIVIGIFGFRSRPDALAAIARLHDFVEAGGNLITLYHRPWDNWDPQRTPPRYLKIGQPSLRWRVTDPAAQVSVLAPDHPLLTTPNTIGPADWADWVKERGLYFASAWDDAYTPLVAMADPGEEPHQGALLSARIGKGRHTHTGLILHYQMDFLVPGAFRLFANMIAKPT